MYARARYWTLGKVSLVSLLVARNISLSFGPRVLFDRASLVLDPGDKVGLVGPNGSGKSTLLKILAGVSEPDSGEIQLIRRTRVGYLPQELAEFPEGPLVDSVLARVPGRLELEEDLQATEQGLAQATETEEQLELAGRLAELQETLDAFESRFGRHRAEQILSGLGFRPRDYTRQVSELSGGWLMRAALAGLLLSDPDVLLLDEPTNHLDVPTLAWFDAFLRRSAHALILISHDRDFLNRQIDRVVSLELEGVRSWNGDYDDYRNQRDAQKLLLEAKAAKQDAKRAQLEAFIERFRAKASKAKAVKSKEKALAREEEVALLGKRRTVDFSFPPGPRSGRDVIRVENLCKAWGEKVVYEHANAHVLRGERVAIVGPNGAGKTTLLKMIAGELEPDEGLVALGHNVVSGYFAQHHADLLDPRKTVLEEVSKLVPDWPQSRVRGVLGAFLFTGDDVEKPVRALSGGERARVALARLLVVPANLLLMDEPTNHLDLDSSEALIDALDGYEGTLVFVSHNRSFVNRLATVVWEVDDGAVTAHPGNLDDWLHHKALVAESTAASENEQVETKVASHKERRRQEAMQRQARSAREKPIRKEIERLEARIADVEAVAKQAEELLADPELYADVERMREADARYRQAKEELDGLFEAWTTQQEALEALGDDEPS